MTTPDPTLAARLAPCPFCGDAARTQQNGWMPDRRPTWWEVACDNCDFAGPGFDTEVEAVTAWNTRSNQLITTAEADARVKAAVLAGNAMVKQLDTMMLMLSGETAMTKHSLERALSGALDARNMWTDAIRSRGVAG